MTRNAIAKRNRAYGKMDSMQRRMTIAKEVILLMDAEKITAGHTYCSISFGDNHDNEEKYKKHNLQNLIIKDGATCAACANGAVLFAKASIANKVMIEASRNHRYYSSSYESREVSIEVFGEKLTAILEMLYEGWPVPVRTIFKGHEGYYTPEEEKLFADMRSAFLPLVDGAIGKLPEIEDWKNAFFPLRTVRMRLLYQNIIDNNGQFILAGHTF